MENGILPYIEMMKSITTLNLAADIRAWVKAKPERSEKVFADRAGISLRTLQYIINYTGGKNEPNWTRSTIEGIMEVLECDAMYTPKHEIK